MNLKEFLVAALSSALDLHIATPSDIIRHVTPDVLAQHLPRPLWARLLTACVGAPKVDAQLVVETIGVPNLCEHVPSTIMWTCLSEIAQRSLGGAITEPIAVPIAVPSSASKPITSTQSKPVPLATPPPPDVIPSAIPAKALPLPSVLSSSIPAPASADSLADVVAALEADDRAAAPARARTPSQRFRQSNTGIGRLANSASNSTIRRPQANASPPAIEPPAAPGGLRPRRGQTEADAYDLETDIKDDWKNALAVEDEQLVDWQATDETVTTLEDSGRKR